MHRYIEIGSLRERVELVEEPVGPPRRRTGRIRHANGENVAIDLETLEHLMERARAAGADGRGDRSVPRTDGRLYA